MTKFFVDATRTNNKPLRATDSQGKVILGPYDVGSAKQGPFYNSEDVPAMWYSLWLASRAIIEIELQPQGDQVGGDKPIRSKKQSKSKSKKIPE